MNFTAALFCLGSLAFVFVDGASAFTGSISLSSGNNSEDAHAENHRVMRKRSTSEMEGHSIPEEDVFDLCQDPSLDAATRTQNGNTYVFKGNYYWKVLNGAVAEGYPMIIVDDWEGLQSNLNAALTLSNGKTFFFKGTRYWRFTNMKMDCGYPKDISVGFPGIPSPVDAAFVYSGNGKPYFFKGQQYWAYDASADPPVTTYYPQQISQWSGLPNDIDAAVQWENHKTYFFKGDKYYLYNDGLDKVDTASYPRSTAGPWFGCTSTAGTSDCRC